VPAVDEVELGRDLISNRLRGKLAQEAFVFLGARVEVPGCVGPVEVEDGPYIVAQNNVDVETAGDEPARLEEVVVVRIPGGLVILGARSLETIALVDPKSSSWSGNVAVKTKPSAG
jgi:hypothetical protein